MILSFKEFLLEGFDTVSDFLLNPAHRTKTFDELMKEFAASGGREVDRGTKGVVYEHPSWPYVIKTFSRDDCYLHFARFAYKNPHKSFPKLFGPPQQIVPFYTRYKEESKIYIARIEKLEPTDPKIAFTVFNLLDSHSSETEAILRHNPQFASLVVGYYLILNSKPNCAFDWNHNNLMKRKNGDLVWADPLWEGSNPYIDARRAFDSEIDRYGYEEEPPPPDVMGGKLPHRIRKKKPKSKPFIYSNDIPF